ncbi:hypothetical protein [Streptomyces macrosporus]|uniref:hypothetical protein n=1 Tax=Streptomyces macrosporus TaxID=44032 RepID=UPI0031DB0884
MERVTPEHVDVTPHEREEVGDVLVPGIETLPHRSEAMIHPAMIDLMSRRLTGEATPNWRGTRTTKQTDNGEPNAHLEFPTECRT